MPDVDATIVTRMLDAGGTIVGKAHCEYFCFSGGSHTERRRARCTTRARWATRPAARPRAAPRSWRPARSTMAIGGDQGGSIRMPAAYCGIYGMKPTHGLVPYTGVMPIELTIDHTGPMTGTVRRQRADARGAGRPRRPRSAPASASKADAYTEALRATPGPAHRHRQGRLRPRPLRDGRRRRWCARPPSASRAGRRRRRGVDPDAPLGPAIWMPIAAEGAT